MKFVLLSVVCLFGAVLAKPASTKQKRDILPGDPRYGTDYHHQHHHHQQQSHENENQNNVQAPHQRYGPPNYTPGTPIHHEAKPSEAVQTINSRLSGYQVSIVQAAQIPIIPQQEHTYVSPANNGYLAPAATAVQVPLVQYTTAAPFYEQPEQVSNGYLSPSIEQSQQNVHHPTSVNSYGTPVPEYKPPLFHQPTHNDDVVVKSSSQHYQHPFASAVHQQPQRETNHHEVTMIQQTPIHHVAPGVYDAPVQSHVRTESHSHEDLQQQAVKSVQQDQGYRAVQPVHDRQTVQQTVQPAAYRQQLIYQSAPETYTSGYYSNGYENSGNFDNSVFQATFASPNYHIDTDVVSQNYNTDLGNLGLGYQGDHNGVLHNGYLSPQRTDQSPQTHHYKKTNQFNHQTRVHQDTRTPQSTLVQRYPEQVQSQQSTLIGANGGYVY